MSPVLGKEHRSQFSDYARTEAQSIISHPAFNTFFGGLIFINFGTMLASVEWQVQHDEESYFCSVALQVCNVFFLIELLIRLGAQREKFLSHEARGWNLFDAAMVGISLIDFIYFILEVSSLHWHTLSLNIIMVIKALRVFKILRVFRFFHQLLRVVVMVVDAVNSLV